MAGLFDSLTIRDVKFSNRAWVSPMCMYSSKNGIVGSFHKAHLGSMILGGAGLVMVEATAIEPAGRISIGCPGIYNHMQVEAFREITDLAHQYEVKMGIQLAHAGRKGSAQLPWADHPIATAEEGGWQTVAPSAVAFDGYPVPAELSLAEIDQLVRDWGHAARNAIAAGFDVLEIHAAHGYLLHEFCSPLSNHRSDQYGGSFDNRTRIVREVVNSVRSVMPAGMPLFVRISASDWSEGGWSIEESVELARKLKELGADLIDTSSGGNVATANIPVGPGYQVHFAHAVREQGGITTSAVGMITDPHQANEVIESGKADAVMLGREFLRNPRWVQDAALALGAKIAFPKQYIRAKPANL
jgi:2,4-dienoyl-CoA reductase-like NADH-dependent reductase (Old Yellow Enzyme family)